MKVTPLTFMFIPLSVVMTSSAGERVRLAPGEWGLLLHSPHIQPLGTTGLLGMVMEFLGMVMEFLGTIRPFLGTRCPWTEVLSDFALCQKCVLRNSFQGRDCKNIYPRWCRPASHARRRRFALHVDHLHSLLPENVPKLQRRMPRKERLSREFT
jgi:hypothetical protein